MNYLRKIKLENVVEMHPAEIYSTLQDLSLRNLCWLLDIQRLHKNDTNQVDNAKVVTQNVGTRLA
jgi:hypothetical protein